MVENKFAGPKTCLFIFIGTALISFINSVVIQRFNGDFAGVPISINFIELFMTFVFTVLPFMFLWLIFLCFDKVKVSSYNQILLSKRITSFFTIFLLWSFFVTLVYGVGIMAVSEYTVPSFLSYIIYFTNRIDPFYLGVLFILTYRGRYIYLYIIPLCILGVLRGGVGVFLYVSLALIIRNNISIIKIASKRPLITIFIVVLFPLILEAIFSVRALIRSETLTDNLTVMQLIVGKLVGRFSSFSNLGMIIQDKNYFIFSSSYMEPFYFFKHYLSAFLGQGLIPQIIPERLLINIFGGEFVDKSYMVGLAGNLYVSSFISPLISLANLLLVFFTIILVFIVSNLIGIIKAKEYAFILLLYPMMSGSALEFSKLLLSLLLIFIILCIYRLKLRTNSLGEAR